MRKWILLYILPLFILACGDVQRGVDINSSDKNIKSNPKINGEKSNQDKNEDNKTNKSVTICDDYTQADPQNEIYIIDPNKECSPRVDLYHHDFNESLGEFKPYSEYNYDDELKMYKLVFHSNGLKNALHILGYKAKKRYQWNEDGFEDYQGKYRLSFRAKCSDYYAIFIVTNFDDHNGSYYSRDLVYTPDFRDESNYISDEFMRYKLDDFTCDNKWHQIQRDIKCDIATFDKNATIKDINGFAIKGSIEITDLKFSRD